MYTTLIKALEEDNFDLAKKIILENKDDIINTPDDEENSPLHLLTNLSLYEKEDLTPEKVKMMRELAIELLEKGAKPNVKDMYGSEPIHYVALSGNILIFQKLLEKGANYNATDLADETPLHQAIRKKQDAIIDLLLTKKDLTLQKTKPDGLTQIDYAKKYYLIAQEKLKNYFKVSIESADSREAKVLNEPVATSAASAAISVPIGHRLKLLRAVLEVFGPTEHLPPENRAILLSDIQRLESQLQPEGKESVKRLGATTKM